MESLKLDNIILIGFLFDTKQLDVNSKRVIKEFNIGVRKLYYLM